TERHLEATRPSRRRRALCAALAIAVLGAAALARDAAAASQRKLVDIQISPALASVIPGRTQAFTATGVYSDNTTADLTGQVTWAVRDPRVATIDATGLATAVGSGRTDISASVASARVAARHAARLEVAELDSMVVDPVSANVRVGGSVVLKAIGTYDNGTTGIDITPQVQWASKKKSVVQIGTNADGAVVAIGVAAGQTNVEARDPETGVRSESTTGRMNVVGTLVSIEVTPDDRIIRVGERVRYKATGTFEKGYTTDVSTDVDWSTGNAAVATADAEGRVTGAGIGSTSVVATDRDTGISSTDSGADGRVEVVGDLTSLTVRPTPLSLALGARTNMKAQAIFQGVTKAVNVTTKVEWRTTDPAKVSVTRTGVATCLSAGSVMLSVRDPFSGLTSTTTGGDALVRCGVPVV